MTKTRLPMFPVWTPSIIIRLLGQEPTTGDAWQDIRQKIVGGIDGFGLNAPESASLHTLKNTEVMKTLMEQLATPRQGERTNLEKILSLLEVMAKNNGQLLKGQVALDERLAELELQIVELKAFLMN